jgi:hypothetical protein
MLLVPLAAGGCRDRPLGPLVAEAEKQRLETWALGLLSGRAGSGCDRPVLRGVARSGDGTRALQQLLTPSPALERCLSAATELDQEEGGTFSLSTAFYSDLQWSRPNRQPRGLRDPGASAERLAPLLSACRPLLDGLRQVVAHGQVCSPFQAGGAAPLPVRKLIALAEPLAAEARRLHLAGQTPEAIAFLLDALRLTQDLDRGDVSLLVRAATGALTGRFILTLELLLNAPAPLGRETLASILRQLDGLIASEPAPAAAIRGELLHQAIYEALPRMKGPGWTPPGGWGSRERPGDTEPHGLVEGVSMPDALAVALAVVRQAAEELPRRCPAAAPLPECLKGWAGFSRWWRPERPGALAASVPAALTAQADRAVKRRDAPAVRRLTAEIWRWFLAKLWADYLPRLGLRATWLGALRLQATYRLQAELDQECPPLAALDRPDLAARRVDPSTGRRFELRPADPGRFLITNGVALEGTGAGSGRVEGVITICPY